MLFKEDWLVKVDCLVAEDWLAGWFSGQLTYCVVGCQLEEVWGQDGRSKEPQEDEAAHSCVPHIQVICKQTGDTFSLGQKQWHPGSDLARQFSRASLMS